MDERFGPTPAFTFDLLNKACADLVNAAGGSRWTMSTLGIEGGKGDFSVTVLPRTTDRDAVLKVDFRNLFVAQRPGRQVQLCIKPCPPRAAATCKAPTSTCANAVGRRANTAGDALLIATPGIHHRGRCQRRK